MGKEVVQGIKRWEKLSCSWYLYWKTRGCCYLIKWAQISSEPPTFLSIQDYLYIWGLSGECFKWVIKIKTDLSHGLSVNRISFVLWKPNRTKEHQNNKKTNKQKKTGRKKSRFASWPWGEPEILWIFFQWWECSLGKGKVLLRSYRDDFTGDVYFGKNQPLFPTNALMGKQDIFSPRINNYAGAHPPCPFLIYCIYWAVVFFHGCRNKGVYFYDWTPFLFQPAQSLSDTR